MTDQELISIIDQEIANSVGYYSGKLADDRRTAMEYYYGEPFGNEVDGQSQFVSQDVADTIEWIMPALMKIFMSTEDVVLFEPHGPEDEEGAKQETDYANYVFTKQNPGFVVLYSFFKDALLQKNGFVKVYWEDYKERQVEDFSNLDEMELTRVFQELSKTGAKVNILSQSEKGIRFEVIKEYGKICVDPTPPDEVLVSKNATWDLQKARCVVHRSRKTASDLKEMGIDNVDELRSDDDPDFGLERQERFHREQDDTFDEEGRDKSQRIYVVDEAYILIDFDDDGVSERRKILKCGSVLLEGDDFENNIEVGRVPFETTTPIIMPHKLYGRSVAELIMDLQLLKSTLIRQILNNMYLTNNPRSMVLDGMVNIDDLLTVRSGGIVRVKTFDAVKPLPIPFFGAPAFEMLSYIDQIRENRSGTRYFQGIDPNALSNQTSGVAMSNFVNASMERIELIARIFAETGVKGIFQAIRELAHKHVKKAQVIRLRNKWVPVDPTDWTGNYDVTVTVGLGTGSKEQFLRSATLLGEMQQKIAEGGMFGRVVTEQNVYNLAYNIANTIEPKKADQYFTDPKGLPPPQPPPDPPEVAMQRDKAVMADKTKRDTKAVDFLAQIAMLANQPKQPMQDPAAEAEAGRQHDFQLQDRKAQAEMEKEQERTRITRESTEATKMDTENTMKVMNMMTQLAQLQQESQKQQAQMLEQMMKIMKAPKKLVTDANGDPIGVEPVMSD